MHPVTCLGSLQSLTALPPCCRQVRDLERGVDVVVGTPGRVIDLIERGSLKLGEVR